jgi:hypothetical protein
LAASSGLPCSTSTNEHFSYSEIAARSCDGHAGFKKLKFVRKLTLVSFKVVRAWGCKCSRSRRSLLQIANRLERYAASAAHFGFGGAMLLDLPGPALRLLTDVADFHFSDIPVRGDDGARAIGANDAAAVELRGRRRQHP